MGCHQGFIGRSFTENQPGNFSLLEVSSGTTTITSLNTSSLRYKTNTVLCFSAFYLWFHYTSLFLQFLVTLVMEAPAYSSLPSPTRPSLLFHHLASRSRREKVLPSPQHGFQKVASGSPASSLSMRKAHSVLKLRKQIFSSFKSFCKVS